MFVKPGSVASLIQQSIVQAVFHTFHLIEFDYKVWPLRKILDTETGARGRATTLEIGIYSGTVKDIYDTN